MLVGVRRVTWTAGQVSRAGSPGASRRRAAGARDVGQCGWARAGEQRRRENGDRTRGGQSYDLLPGARRRESAAVTLCRRSPDIGSYKSNTAMTFSFTTMVMPRSR